MRFFFGHMFKRLTLAAFLLQAAIPLGYMPAAFGSGSIVEICPSGLPAEIVSAMYGHGSHHQHLQDDGPEFVQCDLGGGLGSPAPQKAADSLPLSPTSSPDFAYTDYRPVASNRGKTNQPRSPPQSRSI